MAKLITMLQYWIIPDAYWQIKKKLKSEKDNRLFKKKEVKEKW